MDSDASWSRGTHGEPVMTSLPACDNVGDMFCRACASSGLVKAILEEGLYGAVAAAGS